MTTPHDRFEPGDGWREVDAAYGQEYIAYGGGEKTRYWVREDPVPPLPTEPYTVIRAVLPDGLEYDLILRDQGWQYVGGGGGSPRTDMIRRITGFEVLAEPRAGAVMRAEESARRLTAKAVLDRVRFLHLNTLEDWTEIIDTVAREFRVSS